MGQIVVRNLDEKIIKRLRNNAEKEGRSLQAQVKMILERETRFDPEKAKRLTKKISQRFKGRKFSDSAELVREDRDR